MAVKWFTAGIGFYAQYQMTVFAPEILFSIDAGGAIAITGNNYALLFLMAGCCMLIVFVVGLFMPDFSTKTN